MTWSSRCSVGSASCWRGWRSSLRATWDPTAAGITQGDRREDSVRGSTAFVHRIRGAVKLGAERGLQGVQGGPNSATGLAPHVNSHPISPDETFVSSAAVRGRRAGRAVVGHRARARAWASTKDLWGQAGQGRCWVAPRRVLAQGAQGSHLRWTTSHLRTEYLGPAWRPSSANSKGALTKGVRPRAGHRPPSPRTRLHLHQPRALVAQGLPRMGTRAARPGSRWMRQRMGSSRCEPAAGGDARARSRGRGPVQTRAGETSGAKLGAVQARGRLPRPTATGTTRTSHPHQARCTVPGRRRWEWCGDLSNRAWPRGIPRCGPPAKPVTRRNGSGGGPRTPRLLPFGWRAHSPSWTVLSSCRQIVSRPYRL